MVYVAISVVLFSFLTTFIGLSHASASLWLSPASFSNGPHLSSLLPTIRGDPCLVCLLAIKKAFQKAIPLRTVIPTFTVHRPSARCTSKLWALYAMFLTSFVRPCIRKRAGGEFHIGIHNMYSLHVCIVTVWILFLLYLHLCTVIAHWQERGGGRVPTYNSSDFIEHWHPVSISAYKGGFLLKFGFADMFPHCFHLRNTNK